MNLKRIIGIVVCIAGVVLLFISNYIKNQVTEGKEQIAAGKERSSRAKPSLG